jgi:hypothetical protein
MSAETVAEPIAEAGALMMEFAERTGLTSQQPPQRYLWTDSFAVCNFLGLSRLTGESRYAELALQLVDQVHHVLGRYRKDDSRTGWLSGLDAQEGELHPTRGGLRIGKKRMERGPNEPFDERLEWDRDGQYFHYLTKWMHALDQVASLTRDPRYNLWALELAEVAHAAFTRRSSEIGSRRAARPTGLQMVWKMSTDLSRPLVPSMGQHDPLDGLLTYLQLESTALLLSSRPARPSLKRAIADFASLLEVIDPRTDDPLGLGGLLSDAYRVAQLMRRRAFEETSFLESLLAAAQAGLSVYERCGDFRQPAGFRLAFRELGLAIGLSAVELLQKEVDAERRRDFYSDDLRARLSSLTPQLALGAELRAFWRDAAHRKTGGWLEHRDINEVMLATSLIPEGFLVSPLPP